MIRAKRKDEVMNHTLYCFCANKKMREPFKDISLSYVCIQVILGSVLGDGSLKIQKNYKNARLQIRHSVVQKEYLIWKAEQLNSVGLLKLQKQKADGFSKNEKISFQSKAVTELTQIFNIVCQANKLDLQLHWLNALDELALLIWWLDDGSLVSQKRQGCLCTDSFDNSSHQILQQYFIDSWQIYTRIGIVSRANLKNTDPTLPPYNRLYFNNTELQKLFHLIMPLLKIKSMVRKFAIQYTNRNDQKRWISNMKKVMPNFHDEINRLYGCVKD